MRIKKIIAMLLALCLILSAVPVSAANVEQSGGEIAAEQQSGAVTAEPGTPAVPEVAEEVTVIREEESLRGEYEKHFLMSDGSYQAEVYAYPVHELVDGVWVELAEPGQNARGHVTAGRETTNILDNFVWKDHGVQSSAGLRLYIGSRSGYTARTYIQFATMPTIPAGATITAATMKLTMVSGTSLAYNASAYQVTGGEWDPTTIQWTNKPAANILLEANISNNDRTKYQFSVLTAVQHWYDGDPTGQNENYGIMLRYYDESLTGYYNSVYSGDVVDTNSRPRLTITYQPVVNEVSILRGVTRTLSVTGYTGTIAWSSSDPTVATVSTAGVVTGVKAGRTTVTASAGGEELAEFNVFVTIQSGVYYIKRSGSLYMGTSGGVADGTTAALQTVATTNRGQLNQLWRIDYLGVGYYTVRPLYNMNMALRSTNGAVDMTTVGYSNVPYSHKWTIEGNGSGYVLKNRGLDSAALRCFAPYPEAGISTATYSSTVEDFVWLLEGMSSVTPRMLLMDSQTGAEVPGTTVAIDPGTTSLITQIGVTASFVCPYSTSQAITWVVQDSSVLTINNSNGEITPLKPGGITKVTASHIYNGVAYGVDFYVYLLPVLNGTYAIRSKAYNRYIQIDYDDNLNGFSTNGASLEQGTFVGDEHQMWEIIWRDNAYCSIISALSGKAISVPSGQTANENVTLVQETYTGSDRQLWRITVTEQGQYKIKAKSAEGLSVDLVMSAGNEANGDQEGVAIKQYQYSDDSNYRDEWIIQPILNVGFSTDNYGFDNYGVDIVYPNHRASYLYATTFSDILRDNSEYAVSIKHRYNKDFSYGASKADFGVNGAISNEIDFMVYIGHGHSSINCSNDTRANHIQYSYATDGTKNTSQVCGNSSYNQEMKDKFCLYTDEVRFGSSESNLRWVWMYTCNFLNSIEDYEEYHEELPIDGPGYVTDEDLKEMMTGVHIVMGYTTQSYLCSANVELFGQYLCNGESIIEAFFNAGDEGEGCGKENGGTDACHVQKVMYIPQARYETIYSPREYYEYDASDVLILKNEIQDSND